MISTRAKSLLENPSAIMTGHEKCSLDPFSQNNPNGMLNFGIAENRLIDDLAVNAFAKAPNLDASHIHYAPLEGIMELRQNFASFAKKFLNAREIEAEKVAVQSGLSSVCEAMAFALFEEGDEILVPAPFYTGFKVDFEARFKVKLVPVSLSNFRHNIQEIEQAATSKTKGLLITNPHNPLGQVLPESFLREAANFCKRNNYHLISDEIYALSVHDGRKHPSILEVEKDYENIHLLYGMAKDFGMAGVKTGFHYTRNESCFNAVRACGYFHPVATTTQASIAAFLSHHEDLKNFIAASNGRVASSLKRLLSLLPKLQLITPEAGMFFIADFRRLLKDFKGEEELFDYFLSELKINITPGREMGIEEHGFFRICYARPLLEIEEFAKRLGKVL